MSEEFNLRKPGKRAFLSRPRLVLVRPAQGADRPAPKVEHDGRPPSQEIKEMLREMNQRRAPTRKTDTPDVA